MIKYDLGLIDSDLIYAFKIYLNDLPTNNEIAIIFSELLFPTNSPLLRKHKLL